MLAIIIIIIITGKQKWPQSGHSMSRVGIFLGFSLDRVSSKALMEGMIF